MNIIGLIKRIFLSNEDCLRSQGVKIGKHSWISTRKFPSEGFLVSIGDYVRVANGTSFYTHGGIWSMRFFYNDPDLEHFGKIEIGDYTSIGANCMIMPGVKIGKNCIVGGGSVVTKSIPDGCMVAGNPAKFIGYTDEFYKKLKSKNDFACKRMNHEEKINFILNQPDDMFVKKGYIKTPNIEK